MTALDIAVAGILLVSMLVGLWRGLIYEVMALLGWPVAFVLSRLFAGEVVALLPVEQEPLRVATAYVLVFVAVLLVWAVLTRLLSKLLKKAGGDWTDRVLGGLFGMLRGGLVVLVLVWLIGLTKYVEHPLWREAQLGKTLEETALLTKAWLPDIVAQRIHYGTRN